MLTIKIPLILVKPDNSRNKETGLEGGSKNHVSATLCEDLK